MATIDILMPTPLQGSGGHRTIVANAEHLAADGHRVRLHVQKQRRQRDPVGKTRKWFPVSRCEVLAGWPDKLLDSDAVMATAWFTAAPVAELITPGRRLYFVQDYEPLFHPAGDLSLAATASYDLGLETLVIGNWLCHKLWADHRVATSVVPFGADLRIYYPTNGARGRQVAAIYQPDKPRRCPELVRSALSLVLEAGVQVVTFGSSQSVDLGPGHRHLGIIPPVALASVYQQSSAGLCISASNPSRVPFEMMACGLPVVEAHLPNTLYDLPEGGALLARPDAPSLARALLMAVDSHTDSWTGIDYMQAQGQEAESQAFAAFALGDLPPTQRGRAPCYTQPAVIN